MSVYHILPSPDICGGEQQHTYWENGFSQDEIKAIVNYGDGLIKLAGVEATTGNGEVTPDIRKSKLAWIEHNNQMGWLYDKLGFIIRQINGQYFNFDISGFGEHFQYTVYNGNDQAFYDWHIDKGNQNGSVAPRKLSMVVQLSDPTEYEGGELQLFTGAGIEKKGMEDGSLIEQVFGDGIQSVSKKQGIVHIFPSWVVHRVTPVTRGTRKSLVIWVCGPKFR
jgi:PKHD-type hydroxylase